MMRQLGTLFMLLGMSGALGCNRAKGHQPRKIGTEQTELPSEPRYSSAFGSPRPGPTIRIVPDDMTTQVGQSPLQILVDNGGRAIGKEVLNQIASKVKLTTWPERTQVDAKLTIADITERRENGYQVFAPAVIDVKPAVPLQGRWYALAVEDAPAGTGRAPTAFVTKMGTGGIAARFAVGSDPRLARIRRCSKGDGTGKIVLDFSERVQTASIAAMLLDVGGTSCAVQIPRSDSGTSESVTAICDKLDRARPIEMALGSVTGASGLVMRNSGATMRVEPASFVSWGACDMAEMSGP